MNLKVLTHSALIIIGIVAIIGVFIFFQGQTEPRVIPTFPPLPTTVQSQTISNNTVGTTLDVLQALADYYVASVTIAEEDEDFTGIMTSLLNQNKYLESGKISIKKHLNSSSEVVQLTTQGMTLGADMVIKANNALVQFIRKTSPNDPNIAQEFQYAVATYLSNQKEGYKTISISSPQIGYLFFEPAKEKNPTGKIPYTITKEERERLLKEIERLFGDELRQYRRNIENNTGKYNSILFSVDAIYNNLAPETYEEANSKQ